MFSKGVSNQRGTILLGPSSSPIGRLQEFLVEYNLDGFHMWTLFHSIVHIRLSICEDKPRCHILNTSQMELHLNSREASLVEAFRRLPPDAAAELAALAERLATLRPNTQVDWSDSWSDQDLKEFTAASVRRLEAEESEEPR